MGAPSIEDWIRINELFTRYAWALDHGDVEGVVGCFTATAVIESPVMGSFGGHDAIRDFAERNAGLHRSGAQMRHVVTNLRVDVDGDHARADMYLLNYLTKNGQVELVSPGEYQCRLVKESGVWMFEYRLVKLDRPAIIEGR
jgi:ketosteroid isomerase-like protein